MRRRAAFTSACGDFARIIVSVIERREPSDGGHVPPGVAVGKLVYWFDTDVWDWSTEVAAMHGSRPGEIEHPTLEFLTRHKHPGLPLV